MHLQYSLQDAWQWAAFSGDFNPIHFDKQWVEKRGGEKLSVHGMLALLDVKQFMASGYHPLPFVKCAVRLRKPLWCDTRYALQRDNSKTNAATVIDLADAHPAITCQLTPAMALPTSSIAGSTELSQPAQYTLQQAFAPLLPNAQQWHYLDALLFRHVLHDDSLLRQKVISPLLPGGTTLEGIFTRYPVVQTHQETIFDAHLFAQWSPDIPQETLTIHTHDALVVGDISLGAIVRIAASTHYQNKGIWSAITLKIGPHT